MASAAVLIASNLLAIYEDVVGASCVGELIITQASKAIALAQVPLFEATMDDVLTKQHVECSIYVLDGVITNEHDGVKAFEDHADLKC